MFLTLPEVSAARNLERFVLARARRTAARRVSAALAMRVIRRPDPEHWLWDIVGPMRTLRTPADRLEVPFGWAGVRVADRCAVRVLPCWIAWPYLAWTHRWSVLEPLVRVGLVKLGDGAYWNTARPWFWNAEREASFRAIFHLEGR